MKSTQTRRPSLLCAAFVPVSRVRVSVIADVPRRPQAHQVRAQAELARALMGLGGGYGANGFRGSKGIPSAEQLVTDVRGVPPRGRPV